MNNYIHISTLNDFVFCPYSIYLHNVYIDSDEGQYQAKPQTQGKIAHKTIDSKRASRNKNDLVSFPVISHKYRLMGRIDIYRYAERILIERKYQIKQIFQGQIYQLWAQYICLKEMGYDVDKLAFYEISTNKMIPINLPNEESLQEFKSVVLKYLNYDPEKDIININHNKCKHCIYCGLCDKTEVDNVY